MKKLTTFPINYTNLTQDEMYKIFDRVCSSVSLTYNVSKYFYELQQYDNKDYIGVIKEIINYINANHYGKISKKINEILKKQKITI